MLRLKVIQTMHKKWMVIFNQKSKELLMKRFWNENFTINGRKILGFKVTKS